MNSALCSWEVPQNEVYWLGGWNWSVCWSGLCCQVGLVCREVAPLWRGFPAAAAGAARCGSREFPRFRWRHRSGAPCSQKLWWWQRALYQHRGCAESRDHRMWGGAEAIPVMGSQTSKMKTVFVPILSFLTMSRISHFPISDTRQEYVRFDWQVEVGILSRPLKASTIGNDPWRILFHVWHTLTFYVRSKKKTREAIEVGGCDWGGEVGGGTPGGCMETTCATATGIRITADRQGKRFFYCARQTSVVLVVTMVRINTGKIPPPSISKWFVPSQQPTADVFSVVNGSIKLPPICRGNKQPKGERAPQNTKHGCQATTFGKAAQSGKPDSIRFPGSDVWECNRLREGNRTADTAAWLGTRH